MYPFIDFFGIPVYIFWLTITICFFLFLRMLKKLSVRFSFDYSLFSNNILRYFLSIFFFSRLFYVISKWNDMKYIKNSFEFFIMWDYNFSLFWAIFGFFFIFYFKIKVLKHNVNKYLDWILLSFLFILVIAYLWALLWWQVYWRPTDFWIEISYTSRFSSILDSSGRFPLPIIYSILFFIVFSILYILSMYIKVRWFIGYIWFAIFASIILWLEFFSWKFDFFKDTIWINMSQIWAIFMLIICWKALYKMVKQDNILNQINLHTKE